MTKLYEAEFLFAAGPISNSLHNALLKLREDNPNSSLDQGANFVLWHGERATHSSAGETTTVASGVSTVGGELVSTQHANTMTPTNLANFANKWRGHLAAVSYDSDAQQLSAVTDHLRLRPLHYSTVNDSIVLATDIRLIANLPGIDRSINLDSISQYLDYEYIPPPHSMYTHIKKLEMGYALNWDPKRKLSLNKYWQPTYPGDLTGTEEELSAQLTEQIESTITRFVPTEDNANWGSFLSGGTDSSTIAGVLASASKDPINTFSIGFSEEVFDELTYARMASKKFGANGYEKIMSASDSLDALDDLMQANDEPFGNPSCLATIGCTKLAASNSVRIMLGGDGGDEIFGGNERYAIDQVYSTYHKLPGFIRTAAKSVATNLPGDSLLVNKLRNITHRGNLANPDRFFSGDSFATNEFEELYTPEFREQVKGTVSLQTLQRVYEQANCDAETHRMMFMDLYMAISGNDIVKVNSSAKAAGIDYVKYPFLDVDLIEFTGRLPAQYKVKAQQKRYLFKKAVRNIVPAEILSKKKQGFGLPVSVWMRDDPKFIELVEDCLFSSRATQRGYFNTAFLRDFVSRHQAGAWDYSPEIWRLVVLELWHRQAEAA